VVVTYNSVDVIQKCLDSLRCVEADLEVVIVDNASTDGTSELVAQCSWATLIRNATNAGFARAVNQGVKATRGDPIVLLNPDAQVRPGCLAALTERLRERQVAIVGCKILDPDGTTIQHMGGVIGPNGLSRHIGRGEKDTGQYDTIQDVEYATGAALAVRRDAWQRLGGFDEGYWPAYYEETELCWKARAQGYRVVVEAQAVVVHDEGSSSVKGGRVAERPSVSFLSSYHRNRLRFVLRNFSWRRLLHEFPPAELHWLFGTRTKTEVMVLLRCYGRALVALPRVAVYRIVGG
jgi:GT2 family glycosyltransferase